MRPVRVIVTALILLTLSADLYSQKPRRVESAGFGDDWSERWQEAQLASRSNRFTVVEDDGGPVLRAESERSASALWYRLEIPPADGSAVSWRWKVEAIPSSDSDEREKRGDDYAARFFVIFDAEPFSREARAVCYVWAASEPVGSTYRNPYFSDVVTVVLQSGDARAGEWVLEERDFVSDYREAFGESPESVSAVAVMVDTDNTRTAATAWFGDIRVWMGGTQPW